MAVVSLLLGLPQKGTKIQRSVGGQSSTIVLDATISEQYSARSQVTQHPIEGGANVADHVIDQPDGLRIKGKVSETPFAVGAQVAGVAASVASKIGQNLGGAIGGAAAGIAAAKTLAGVLKPKSVTGREVAEDKLPGETARLRDAVKEFENIRDSKQLVTIITGLKQYSNYILVGLDVTRDTETGGSINVDLEFEQVQFAETDVVAGEIPAIKSALPTANQGAKKPEPVASERASSILSTLTGFGE